MSNLSQFYKINRSNDVYEIIGSTDSVVTLSLVGAKYTRQIGIASLHRHYTSTDKNFVPQTVMVKGGAILAKAIMKREGKRVVTPPRNPDLGTELDEFTWSEIDETVTVPKEDVMVRCCACHGFFPNESIDLCSLKWSAVVDHFCRDCVKILDLISIEAEQKFTLELHS